MNHFISSNGHFFVVQEKGCYGSLFKIFPKHETEENLVLNNLKDIDPIINVVIKLDGSSVWNHGENPLLFSDIVEAEYIIDTIKECHKKMN